jgi:tRNA modification GTPase
MNPDTIFALSSGRPPAAISIIRISGARAHAAGELLAGALPNPRSAALRELRDPESGELLDQALVLRFDSPASSTGEDCLEFQCHGGRAVVDAVMTALSHVEGLRLAEPGEFTRRAFENGRIDLTEAEGLADLIEAETEGQRRAALLVAEGGLAKQIGEWQQQLLALSARAEAAIDYVDDDSVDSDPELSKECAELAGEMRQWSARPRSEPLKEGARVVIAGPPNAGKSSLLNAIAGAERAIVTEIPGTTRDHIEVPLSISGLPIRLTDTAGLRESVERVEQLGVDRARSLIELADVLIWLGEPNEVPSHPRPILVHPRCDLPDRRIAPLGSIAVSSRSGEGLQRLVEAMTLHVQALLPTDGELAFNRRQAAHIEEVHNALQQASLATDPVILAEFLRNARGALDRLTGRAGVEDVLDALFGRFCLGK